MNNYTTTKSFRRVILFITIHF